MANALNVKIGGDIRELEKALNQASAKMKDAGKRISSVGKTLTQAVTLPLLAISGASLKMASDFEASMTKIETLVGLSRDQVKAMEADVISLSRTTGVSAQSLSEALFTVTSAGARGADAMQILTAASKASASGLGETRSIAQAVTASMQAYGKENLSAAKATDIFTAIVREGNLEAERLAPVLGRVIGIASQAGVSFEEVGASIATYTRLGVSAEESTTALRAILSAIVKPTQQSKDALAQLGMTTQDLQGMINQKGLAGSLKFLVESFDGNQEALSQLIPSVEGLSAVLGTAGAQGEQYTQIVDNISNSQGILDEAFDRTTQTAKFQFNQALNDLKTDSLELGNALLPLATKVLSKVRDVMGTVTAIMKQMRPEIVGLSIGFAALGPALVGIGASISAIGVALAALTSPISLTVAGITGLVLVGEYVRRNLGAIGDAIVEEFNSWVLAAKNTQTLMQKAIVSIASFAPGVTGQAARAMNNALKIEQGVVRENKRELQSIGEFAKSMFSDIGNLISGLVGFDVSNSFKPVEDGAQEASESVKQLDFSSLNYLQTLDAQALALQRLDEITKQSSGEMSKAMMFVSDIADSFTSSFGQGMANVVVQGEKLVDTLKNIGRLLASSVIQKALSVFLTGGLGGTGFFGSGGGLFGKIFGVNDALITSAGDVVKFHPDDNILAMKDFSSVSSGGGISSRELSKVLTKLGPREIYVLAQEGRFS